MSAADGGHPDPGRAQRVCSDCACPAPDTRGCRRRHVAVEQAGQPASGEVGKGGPRLPAEQLEAALDVARQRAVAAEYKMSVTLLSEANAVCEARQLQLEVAKPPDPLRPIAPTTASFGFLNASS